MIVEDLPNLAQSPPLWLLLATTLVGAIEGAMIGRKPESDVDLVGMTIYAFFLGLGGALARDTLLGLPSAVIQSFWYPLMVLLGVLIALVLGRFIKPQGLFMVVLDALTLGLYAVLGTRKALDHGVPITGAIVVGLFAALAGGIIVSLLRQERPFVMVPGAPYALLALGGVLIYLALTPFSEALAALGCVGFVIVSRVMTLRWGITTWRIKPLRHDS